jgi:ribosome-interacting GTPase 1
MSEYRIASADIAIRCDATIDDLIDVLEAKSRAYIPVIYALNKIDAITIEELDLLYRIPNACPISAEHGWNVDELLELMWEKLNLVRVYTRPKGKMPDYSAPVVLRSSACTVEDFVSSVYFKLFQHGAHRDEVQRHPQINRRAIQTSHRLRQVSQASTPASRAFPSTRGRRHQ